MPDDIVLMSIIFLTLIVPFSIGYIIISYIKSLEAQESACTLDARRKYVKFYGYSLFIISLLGLLALVIYIRYPAFRNVRSVLKIIVLIIHFLGAWVIFTFSKVIEDKDCKDGENWKKVFLKYYGYILSISISLVFFTLVMSFLILISTGDYSFMLEMQKILLGCPV
jgi:hypothetical protein